MPQTLNYSPGQKSTIIFQVLNADGHRVDGYAHAPVVSRIILPDLTLAAGFPVFMTKLDTGLYEINFTLPTGSTSVGTYIVDIAWYDPDTMGLKQDFIQINVSAPMGMYSVSPG